MFTYTASYIDNVVVGRLIGTVALGLYQMAFTIIDMPRRFLGSVIDRVMFATMSRVQEDTARLRTGYLQSIELANLLLLSVTVFLIIIAPEFVRGILGERWSDVTLPLQILLTQVPLRASIRMADQVGGAVGRVYYVGTTKVLYAAMVGIAAVIGVRWGLTGVATAVTVATVANWLIMVRFGLRVVKASVREYLRAWIPGGRVCVVVMGSALLGTEILRRSVGSDIIRLAATSVFTMLAVLAMVWICPGAMGTTAVRLVLDFGKRTSIFRRQVLQLEKRVSVNAKF